MEPQKERFTFDVPFSDILHKVAKANKHGRHAYIYVPEEWDGYEIALLKLGKKSEKREKVVGEPIPNDPLHLWDNLNLKEKAQEWKEQAAFWQAKATEMEGLLRKSNTALLSKSESRKKEEPKPKPVNEEEELLRGVGL